MSEPDRGDLYRQGRERLTELAGTLTDLELHTPVPGCPGWDVHDVLAHLAGIVADATSGNMDGVRTDPWTARQVADRRSVPTAEVLAEWARLAPRLEPVITKAAISDIVVDVTTHEHDIRGAVGRPGARDAPVIGIVAGWLLDRFDAQVRAAGLPAVRVNDRVCGPDEGEPTASLTASEFELVRACVGRRSVAQLAAMGWSGDPSPYLEHFTVFAPSAADVIE